MPQGFHDQQEVSLAARFRVAHREAAATGGLHVRSQVRGIENGLLATRFLLKSGRWRSWYEHSYFHNLLDAVKECESIGFSIREVEEDLGDDGPRPHTKTEDSHRLQCFCENES